MLIMSRSFNFLAMNMLNITYITRNSIHGFDISIVGVTLVSSIKKLEFWDNQLR